MYFNTVGWQTEIQTTALQKLLRGAKKILYIFFIHSFKKNPAYKRHCIFQLVRIVALIQINLIGKSKKLKIYIFIVIMPCITCHPSHVTYLAYFLSYVVKDCVYVEASRGYKKKWQKNLKKSTYEPKKKKKISKPPKKCQTLNKRLS